MNISAFIPQLSAAAREGDDRLQAIAGAIAMLHGWQAQDVLNAYLDSSREVVTNQSEENLKLLAKTSMQREQMGLYEIPCINMEYLRERVEKMNKRAAKNGLEPMTIEVIGKISRKENEEHPILGYREREYHYCVCRIHGDIPRVDGWQMVAAVTPQDNGEPMLRISPSYDGDIPARYRTTTTYCEHCRTDRYRKDVFLIKHEDGRWAQVGRNCLADFIRGGSPESLLAGAKMFGNILDELSDAEDVSGSYGYGRHVKEVDTEEFLLMTSIIIRKLGWTSRGSVREEGGGRATADWAWSFIFPDPYDIGLIKQMERELGKFEDLERDREIASKALEWARAIPAEGSTDFMYNLGVTARQDTVNSKRSGLAAAIVSCYLREMENELKRKERERLGANSNWVGTIGERENLPLLRVVGVKTWPDDRYGGVKTMIRFVDVSGNIIVWFKSGEIPDGIKEGGFVDMTARIKKHDEYRGTKQTIVSHGKMVRK